jgi:hypothetical protein
MRHQNVLFCMSTTRQIVESDAGSKSKPPMLIAGVTRELSWTAANKSFR